MRTWIGFAAAVAVGVVVGVLPTPRTVAPGAARACRHALTVTLWMLRTISSGIASILMMNL
jgi:hypothetical protein